jgi:hypothetical protein
VEGSSICQSGFATNTYYRISSVSELSSSRSNESHFVARLQRGNRTTRQRSDEATRQRALNVTRQRGTGSVCCHMSPSRNQRSLPLLNICISSLVPLNELIMLHILVNSQIRLQVRSVLFLPSQHHPYIASYSKYQLEMWFTNPYLRSKISSGCPASVGFAEAGFRGLENETRDYYSCEIDPNRPPFQELGSFLICPFLRRATNLTKFLGGARP